MNKTFRFGLIDNPLAQDPDDDRQLIIHLRRPVIIAMAHHFYPDEPDDAEELEIRGTYRVAGSTELPDGERVIIGAIWIEPGYVETGDAQAVADRLAKIMRRMADWYHSYIIWEGRQPPP